MSSFLSLRSIISTDKYGPLYSEIVSIALRYLTVACALTMSYSTLKNVELYKVIFLFRVLFFYRHTFYSKRMEKNAFFRWFEKKNVIVYAFCHQSEWKKSTQKIIRTH